MTRDPALERLDEIPDPLVGTAPAAPDTRAPEAPSPTRAGRATRIAIGAAVGAAWIAVVLLCAGTRADLGAPAVLAPIGAWLVAGCTAVVLLLKPRDRGLPAGIRVIQHALWVVPAAYAGVALAIARQGAVHASDGLHAHATCAALSSAMALGGSFAAAVALRRTFVSAPAWRGAAVGAIVGLSGSIGVHAHCPCQDLDHLLAAHGAPILLFAIAGAAVGRLGGRP